MRNLVLIGFMGAGKTTVGRALADDAGLRFLDTDQYLEAREKMTVSALFARFGEPHFRDLETACLAELLEMQGGMVVAAGGGMPERAQNRDLMRKLGTVVYLRARPETLIARLKGDVTRPKLQGGDLAETVFELLRRRSAAYEQAADRILDTDGRTCEELVKEMETDVL